MIISKIKTGENWQEEVAKKAFKEIERNYPKSYHLIVVDFNKKDDSIDVTVEFTVDERDYRDIVSVKVTVLKVRNRVNKSII